MKECLKMSEFFGEKLDAGDIYNMHMHIDRETADAAAHAINSHDELVWINSELLSALDSITKLKWRDNLAGLDRPTDFAEREAAVRCLGDAASIARAAIAKVA